MRVLQCGACAVLIETDNPMDLLASLSRAPLRGQSALVPAEGTILVQFDSEVRAQEIEGDLGVLRPPENRIDREDAALLVEIVARYDGQDLDAVAHACGSTVDEVVALHSGAEYVVAFCGFAPGFAYLTGLPAELHIPRRATPRTVVPAGSIAIAEHYSAVYPRQSPGGWHLIGSTSMLLFDPQAESPSALVPGMRVRFQPA